ncbi:hypothetical protein MD484_g8845, partial [Candolleomyces efflorescens]
MPAPPGFGMMPQTNIASAPIQANAAGPSGPRSPPLTHSQAPSHHQMRPWVSWRLIWHTAVPTPPGHLCTTFGHALADSRRQGVVGDFMSSNQTSLDRCAVSSAVTRFLTSTPEISAVSDQYTSSLLSKPKLTHSCIEKSQGGIHTFTSNNQGMANQDANDRLSVFAGVPHPKGSKKSLASPPFIVPSQAAAGTSKGPAAAGTSKGAAAGASKGTTAGTSKGAAATETSKQEEAGRPDNRMAITPSVVNGKDAVKAVYQIFSQQVNNSMNLHPSQRPYVLIPPMIKALKELILGFFASRILSGQFPSQGEVIHICRMTAESPEAVLLFSMSRLYPAPSVIKPTLAEWRRVTQVLKWKTDFLRSILLYTIRHVLTSSLIFSDYAYSDPIDSFLGVRTLLLATTGAYMHFYALRSARQHVNSPLRNVPNHTKTPYPPIINARGLRRCLSLQ